MKKGIDKTMVFYLLICILAVGLCACGQNGLQENTSQHEKMTTESGKMTDSLSNDIAESEFDGDPIIQFDMYCYSSYALKANGTLWAWGNNCYGQLGNGYKGDSSYDGIKIQTVPVQIIDNIKTFALGRGYVLALKNDGSLWAWGRNECGQVGNGAVGDITVDKYICQSIPVKILDDVESIYVSKMSGLADAQVYFSDGLDYPDGSLWFSAAIKTDGSLWMWGCNSEGQCGVGESGNGSFKYMDDMLSMQSVPAKVIDNVIEVNLCDRNTAAITDDGNLWIWGSNGWGQAGTGAKKNENGIIHHVNSFTPYSVLPDVKQITIHSENGVCTVAAIQSNGTLWMWGCNTFANVGNGKHGDGIESTDKPVQILNNVKYVDITSDYTAAITDNDELYTWGSSFCYAIGVGETSAYTPTYVMNNVKKIYAEECTLFIVTKEGNLWMSGYDNESTFGVKGTVVLYDDKKVCPRPVEVKDVDDVEEIYLNPIGINYRDVLYALRSDGVLLSFGSSPRGLDISQDEGIFQVLTDVKKCVFPYGDRNTAAIRKNGSLWIWGDNHLGQIGNGSTDTTTEPVCVFRVSQETESWNELTEDDEKQETEYEDQNTQTEEIDLGDNSSIHEKSYIKEEWFEAYKNFVCNKKFLENTGDSRGFDSIDNGTITFALYNLNDDNVPELLIDNGFNGRDLNATYVFTYKDGEVRYCGSTLANSFTIDGWPGLFSSVVKTGWYIEDEYASLYEQVDYLMYQSLDDNRLISIIVKEIGHKIGTFEEVVIYESNNTALLKASNESVNYYKTFTYDEIMNDGIEQLLESLSNTQDDGAVVDNSSSSGSSYDSELYSAKEGEYVTFGSYEQDNNLSNGKEAIRWKVLAKENGKLLLISEYGLDVKPYNIEFKDVTWETCTLRSWLNNDFYNEAFSSTEKTKIETTYISNTDNPVHGTEGGNNTRDRLFLLSLDETLKYFHLPCAVESL